GDDLSSDLLVRATACDWICQRKPPALRSVAAQCPIHCRWVNERDKLPRRRHRHLRGGISEVGLRTRRSLRRQLNTVGAGCDHFSGSLPLPSAEGSGGKLPYARI